MGVRYEWANERQIIMDVYLETPWTWAEFQSVRAIIMPMLHNLNHPCATVVDCSKMGSLPRDGSILPILFNIEKNMPANVFASVVVAAPPIVTIFMKVLIDLRPRAKMLTMFTPTIEEAHKAIHARYWQLYADLSKSL
jgi:hypothetical protein